MTKKLSPEEIARYDAQAARVQSTDAASARRRSAEQLATAGISTEALEAGAVEQLVTALNRLLIEGPKGVLQDRRALVDPVPYAAAEHTAQAALKLIRGGKQETLGI